MTRLIACSTSLHHDFFRFVTIHAFDSQTDRRTDGQTERPSQYRALHCMQSHGKNCHFITACKAHHSMTHIKPQKWISSTQVRGYNINTQFLLNPRRISDWWDSFCRLSGPYTSVFMLFLIRAVCTNVVCERPAWRI